MKTANYPKPSNATLPNDLLEVAQQWAIRFNAALAKKDFGDVFLSEFYWRDHLSLSWDFRTLDSLAKVMSVVESSTSTTKAPGLISIAVDNTESKKPGLTTIGPNGKVNCIQVHLTLVTGVGAGRGVARLVQDSENNVWKAYALYTSLQSLDAHLETTKYHRPTGLNHADRTANDGLQPAVLIVGEQSLLH